MNAMLEPRMVATSTQVPLATRFPLAGGGHFPDRIDASSHGELPKLDMSERARSSILRERATQIDSFCTFGLYARDWVDVPVSRKYRRGLHFGGKPIVHAD